MIEGVTRCDARLEEIDMGEGEWEAYLSYFDRIQTQVQQLRVVLEAIENKVGHTKFRVVTRSSA